MSSLNRKITTNETKHFLNDNDLSYYCGKQYFDEESGKQNYLVFLPLRKYFKLNSVAGPIKTVIYMSNKDSNTISSSTETVRANAVDKEKTSPHMESENPAPTAENNKQNKTNASQITSNQIHENRNQKLKKTAVILGDSMVKHINGWEMAKKSKYRLQSICKVILGCDYAVYG